MGSSSATLLLSMVEDILNFYSMETGNFKLDIDWFSARELLEETIDLFKLQCDLKNIALKLDIDHMLSEKHVCSDRNRTKQVLMNLLSNALKFTFQGGIFVKARLIKDFDREEFLEFEISDTGIGIKEEDHQNLFKPFGMMTNNNGISATG